MTVQRLLSFACFFALLGAAPAEDVLTNDSVLKMVKAKLGEELVLRIVQSQPGTYTITAKEMVRLKKARVPETILAAMVAKASPSPAKLELAVAEASPALGKSAVKIAAMPAPAEDAEIPEDIEIGVYYKSQSGWEELQPEIVNWKTGGVLKRVATIGVINGDVNGNIPGPHSRNSLKAQVEVLIHAREGVALTEYQLIRLRPNDEYREFRTITGGVFHESGGSTRDAVPFEGTKIAKGTYTFTIPALGAGEYGILPPEAVTLSKGSSIGKMYTFRLVE